MRLGEVRLKCFPITGNPGPRGGAKCFSGEAPERREEMTERFEDWWNSTTGQQHHAFHMRVWGALGETPEERAKNLRRLMAGETNLVLEEAVRNLFDRHGRRIPPRGMKASVVDANRDFYFDQKVMKLGDYGLRLTLAAGYLGRSIALNPEEFVDRANALREKIRGDEQLANLLCGAHFPIALPQMESSDYGTALEEVFLPAVGKSYEVHFAGRKFSTHQRGILPGQVTGVPGSRNGGLLIAMTYGPVVGLYFPAAMQGYSASACIEQMATLPDEVLLAGVLEPAMALIMYPDVLARDVHTPGLDCAAISWRSHSLYFRAGDDTLDFDGRGPGACSHCSGGLVVLG